MTIRRWTSAIALVVLGLALSACSDTPANDFEAGECTNDSLTGAVGEIDTVDCDEDHTAEAIGQVDLDDGDYPGDDEVRAQAAEECQAIFEDYVGIAYAESIYTANSINPSEQSWDGGDRTIICVVDGTVDGSPLEGSVEDAGV